MEITFRSARREDVPHLVKMLADDPIAQKRERYADPLPASYYAAFDAIDQDPNHDLVIAEAKAELLGLLQISYLPQSDLSGQLACINRRCPRIQVAPGSRNRSQTRGLRD